MSSSVSDENLEKKFQGATNTQDSIQTLSLWLLHHKAHHQKIVSAWMKVLKKAKISHRLTLFYLANDVVQNGKRKGFLQFGNSFAEVLRDATLLVRDEQIRPSVQRVFTIWEQRSIYSPEFIADLRAILANTKVPATAHSKLLAEFKPDTVIEKLRSVMKLEIEVSTKMSTLNLSKLNATNAEIVQRLKDRTHGQQFKREFDENTRCLEELIKIISKELKERTELILLLEQSEIYYDTQRGEAKIVANAYKNFGARVKTLQKKLEELTATFPSPLPSPCPDAPSPANSGHELELKLPNDKTQTNELENLENAPSPEGTPEGLNLSPAEPVKKETTIPVSTQSVGNPIPTLSNFFSHDQSGMSSWLDTFAKKKAVGAAVEKKTEIPKNDPSSLDSRLSNLLQNIPNLPSGLQSTIFGNSSGNNTPVRDSTNSPIVGKKDGGSTTPIKDEYSGQNTPLQDEESSHSGPTFFSKGSSNSKPKDILTSLIKSVSNDKPDDNFKGEKYGYNTSETYNQTGMPSFIQKIIPTVPPVPQSSSPSFFNTVLPTEAGAVNQTGTINSYETAPFLDIPMYSSKSANQESSFIHSVVPSMSEDDQYRYGEYSTNEYNPELEIFDNEIDIDEELNEQLDHQSPVMDSMSPVPSPDLGEISRSIGNQRLSTLITVVTKDSPINTPDNSLPSSHDISTYKSDKENEAQVPQWNTHIPPPKMDDSWTNHTQAPVQPEHHRIPSPNEEFFIGKEAAALPTFYSSAPPVMEQIPPNGQNINYMNPPPNAVPPPNMPLSNLEPMQTGRDNVNGRWFGNDFVENERLPYPHPPPMLRGPPPNLHGVQETQFFDKRFPPPNFPPRNNWRGNRHRLDHSFHRPYGPRPQNNRYPFHRGRGRGPRHFAPF